MSRAQLLIKNLLITGNMCVMAHKGKGLHFTKYTFLLTFVESKIRRPIPFHVCLLTLNMKL